MNTDYKSQSLLNAQSNEIKTIKGRKQPYRKVGTFKHFEKLYKLVIKNDSTVLFDFKELPPTIDPNRVWSVVEGDNYNWYILPGFHLVNHTGYYLICNNARGDGYHNDYLF